MRPHRTPPTARQQRGSAIVEFGVVGPLLTLLGLALLQYGMLFFSKNQINHASFMAARAGSMGNARLSSIRQAYLRAMVPLYGGGRNSAELADAKSRAATDLEGNLRIDVLNPTRESFEDWNAPYLEQKYGARAIPNAGLAYRDNNVGSQSGQTVQDANLLKLRITHGYELKVPLIASIYKRYLTWLDDGKNSFHSDLVKRGRLPVVTHVTLHMQSDAIEDQNMVSIPGAGNGGNPVNPGGTGSGGGSTDPLDPWEPSDPGGPGAGGDKPPPDCVTVGCTVINSPGQPGPTDDGASGGGSAGDGGTGTGGDGGGDSGGDGNGTDCVGANCPTCGKT